jgi:hypothetical protein
VTLPAAYKTSVHPSLFNGLASSRAKIMASVAGVASSKIKIPFTVYRSTADAISLLTILHLSMIADH